MRTLLLLGALLVPPLAGGHSSPPGNVRGAHWHCDPPDGDVREVICELDHGQLGRGNFGRILFADRTGGNCASLWSEVNPYIHNFRRNDCTPEGCPRNFVSFIPPSQEIIPAVPSIGPEGSVLRFTASPGDEVRCIQAVASHHVPSAIPYIPTARECALECGTAPDDACQEGCNQARGTCRTTCNNCQTDCNNTARICLSGTTATTTDSCIGDRSDCRAACTTTRGTCITACAGDTDCINNCVSDSTRCNDDCTSSFGLCNGNCTAQRDNCNTNCANGLADCPALCDEAWELCDDNCTNTFCPTPRPQHCACRVELRAGPAPTICRDAAPEVYELALSPVFNLDPDYGQEPQSTRTSAQEDGPRHLPLVFAQSFNNEHPQGFVRLANLNVGYEAAGQPSAAGEGQPVHLRIRAFDERGASAAANEVRLDPGRALHFNSRDLEEGNEDKQVGNALGDMTGHWRLEVEPVDPTEPGANNFFAGAYARSRSGFLAAMHDYAERLDYGQGGVSRPHLYPVPIFNPGFNNCQVSHLRVTNLNPDNPKRFYLAALHDSGDRSFRPLGTVQPLATRQWTASQLEGGDCGISTDRGSGKWFLVVGGGPALVTHLIESKAACASTDGTVRQWSNLTAKPPDPANLGEAEEIRNLFYRANEDYDAECASDPDSRRCNPRFCG